MPACRLCGDVFPNRIKVGEKSIHLQRRRYCFACSPVGGHNTRKLTQGEPYRLPNVGLERTCEFCGKVFTYRRGKGSGPRKCASCCTKQRHETFRMKLIEMKGGKCAQCGYSRSVSALCFHHRDPSEKRFSLSVSMNRAWETLVEEVQKCDLLCSNCHIELHANADRTLHSGPHCEPHSGWIDDRFDKTDRYPPPDSRKQDGRSDSFANQSL